MGWWDYFTSEQLAPVIGFLSFTFAAVGLPITFWQATQARFAAEGAQQAASEAKLRMNSFSAMREAEIARSSIQGISKAIEDADWHKVLSRYHDLAGSLTELSECNINFDEDVTKDLRESFAIVDANCATIEAHLSSKKENELLVSKQKGALRPLYKLVVQVRFNLERLA